MLQPPKTSRLLPTLALIVANSHHEGMDLSDIYRTEGMQGLRKLAQRASVSSKYLYQLATGFQGRRCSPSFALRLAAIDPRLSVAQLVFGPNTSSADRADHSDLDGGAA